MTRAELLVWFYRRQAKPASARTIKKELGNDPSVMAALQGLIDLGAVYEYSYSVKVKGQDEQMFGVSTKWARGFKVVELNHDRVDWMPLECRSSVFASSSATGASAKTAASL